MRRTTPHLLAFTLIELLVVVAIISLLSGLLLSAVGKAKMKGRAIACLNHEKQLAIACQMYADDSGDRYPYNLGFDEIRRRNQTQDYINWTTPIMSWEAEPNSDNTNTVLLTGSGLGPYVSRSAGVYRCPSDYSVSDQQAEAGWSYRVRSISMNAMVGDAGDFSRSGANQNNPYYRQFFKTTQVPRPSQIFVFIEEHPESIDDGYFLDRPNRREWHDLPASYHNGGANLTFADGHAEQHQWKIASTKPAARPDPYLLPIDLSSEPTTDFDWLMSRMTVYEARGK